MSRPRSSSPVTSPPRRPLSPSSLRDLSSPSAPLSRSAAFPAPPTGHDLMLLFPPAPPALRDVDIVAGVDRPFAEHQNRLSAFQGEVRARVLAGRYVNTSTWFGKEERAFFAAPSPPRAHDHDHHRSPPSTSSPISTASPVSPVPPPAFPPPPAAAAAHHPHPSPPRAHPPPRPRSSTRTPSPRAHAPPPLSKPGTRRRAGKYTKRVFVQPHPADVAAKW